MSIGSREAALEKQKPILDKFKELKKLIKCP